MNDKLVVSILGNRDSGKSYTWNTLFGKTVRTGSDLRLLFLDKNDKEYVDVFLVSGSPEERNEYVGDLIKVKQPNIVLCSMQYIENVYKTIDYFVDNDYSIYTCWLNPGFNDPIKQEDSLGILSYLLNKKSVVGVRDAKGNVNVRIEEIRDFIYGWARSRNLIKKTS